MQILAHVLQAISALWRTINLCRNMHATLLPGPLDPCTMPAGAKWGQWGALEASNSLSWTTLRVSPIIQRTLATQHFHNLFKKMSFYTEYGGRGTPGTAGYGPGR